MASLSKVLIVVLRPDLKVRYVHALTGDAATLPLLSWHFVVIQLSDTAKVVDPVLAFARDQTIYFVQVSIAHRLWCDQNAKFHQDCTAGDFSTHS